MTTKQEKYKKVAYYPGCALEGTGHSYNRSTKAVGKALGLALTLVLLVIFMITAPIVQQGVEIELPQASANSLPPDQQEPVILTVHKSGDYYLNIGD